MTAGCRAGCPYTEPETIAFSRSLPAGAKVRPELLGFPRRRHQNAAFCRADSLKIESSVRALLPVRLPIP
jgi:hypothetical protein